MSYGLIQKKIAQSSIGFFLPKTLKTMAVDWNFKLPVGALVSIEIPFYACERSFCFPSHFSKGNNLRKKSPHKNDPQYALLFVNEK